jgi:uncharacterized phage protein (TIGR02218 family)
MKTISAALQAHLNGGNTTTALIWKVKRQDGVIFGFTDHDQDITFNDGEEGSPVGSLAVTYVAVDGCTGSAVESHSDMTAGNQDLTLFLDSAAITEQDLFAGLYSNAIFELSLVNWKDLSQGRLKLKRGTFGEVKTKNGMLTIEFRGLDFYFGVNLGETYGPTCRADLGDERCTFNLAPTIQTGIVTGVTDLRTFVPMQNTSPLSALDEHFGATPSAAAPAGWFNEGVLTWLTGANATYKMEVIAWDGTTMQLFEDMPNAISVNDTFTIEPGCDHLVSTCVNKFNNLVNFIGEPNIPGMQQMLMYPNYAGDVPT